MNAAAHRAGRSARGFTLVEVLVALLAMALLAGFAWQALDGIVRTRDAGRETIDRTARLMTVLTQWEQDLQAVYDSAATPSALQFDGQSLRMTRRVDGGVALVVWTVRGGRWQRWSSPAYTRSAEMIEAWLRALQMQGNEAGVLTVAEGASEWQLYFYRGNGWSNAQSTGEQALAPPAAGASAPLQAREALPNAVRMVITLDGQKLTRDIALGPQGN
jgi:general secretion pathway protein J